MFDPLLEQTVAGTLNYIAPEILSKRGYDKSSDCWSIGIVAYILLAGYHPFNGDCEKVFNKIKNCSY